MERLCQGGVRILMEEEKPNAEGKRETVHTLVKPVTLCVNCVNFIICNIISEQ